MKDVSGKTWADVWQRVGGVRRELCQAGNGMVWPEVEEWPEVGGCGRKWEGSAERGMGVARYVISRI